MSIEWFRDLVICIFGLAITVVLIFFTVLFYFIYRRIRSILVSIETTSKTIEGISAYVGEEVIKPVTQIIALVEGIRQGIDTISKLFKKEKGGGDG